MALDPTATTGQTVQLQVTRTNEINSVLDLLQGRGTAERVVEELTPDFILARRQSNPLLDTWRSCIDEVMGLTSYFRTNDEGGDNWKPREDAIKSLEKMLDIYAVRDSNVINVCCQADSPEAAQQIATTLINVYRREHASFTRTDGSEEFFDTQSQLIHENLVTSTEKLREVKNKLGIVSVANRLELLESEKMQIEMERLNVARKLASTSGKLQSLKESIEALDERILAGELEGLPNEAADQMRSQLYDLEMKERELTARYSDDHPFLREIREQSRDVREILESEKGTRSHSSFEVNPNWQQLQLAMLQTNAELAEHTKTHETLAGQYSDIVAEAKELNETVLQIDQLERHIDVQKDNYRKYRENFEQARIDAALKAERITNVNIVQQPTLSRKEVWPNKLVILASGMLMALLSAVGIALYAESSDQRIKSPQELESLLSVPVLISLPRSAKQCIRI
ncbi:MAG: hypothetical protein KDA57_09685 [Planctomycetales bacterium]|nr:hypothetical protein [Planctomycetales bacterium]